jgi:hypothetical protein
MGLSYALGPLTQDLIRLQGHEPTVVGDSLATQKMTNCPRIKGGIVAM